MREWASRVLSGRRRLNRDHIAAIASLTNRVTAQQKMCGQTIAGSETKNDRCDLGRVAILLAPEGLQHLNQYIHGRFIIREKVICVFARTSAPVRPHSARIERTHLDAKRCSSWAKPSVNPPTAYLAAWYAVLPGRATGPSAVDTRSMRPLLRCIGHTLKLSLA
jgi:hypothetical protein